MVAVNLLPSFYELWSIRQEGKPIFPIFYSQYRRLGNGPYKGAISPYVAIHYYGPFYPYYNLV